MLLAGGGGLWRAEWCLRVGGVVVRCGGGEKDRESSESERKHGGDVHIYTAGLVMVKDELVLRFGNARVKDGV